MAQVCAVPETPPIAQCCSKYDIKCMLSSARAIRLSSYMKSSCSRNRSLVESCVDLAVPLWPQMAAEVEGGGAWPGRFRHSAVAVGEDLNDAKVRNRTEVQYCKFVHEAYGE